MKRLLPTVTVLTAALAWWAVGALSRSPAERVTEAKRQPTPLLHSVSSLSENSVAWIQAIRAEGNPTKQIALAAAFAEKAASSDFQRLLELARSFPANSSEKLVERMLLRRWLEADAPAAAAWCLANRTKHWWELGKHWFAKDRAAMLRFAEESDSRNIQAQVWGCYAHALSQSDHEGTISFILEHDKAAEFDSAISELAKRDHQKLLKDLDRLPARLVDTAKSAIVSAWAKTDFAAVWEWAEEEGSLSLKTMALHHLDDAQERLDRISSLSSAAQEEAVSSLISSWKIEDPRAFLANLDANSSLTDGVRMRLRTEAFRNMLALNPEDAARWLNEEPDSEERQAMIRDGDVTYYLGDGEELQRWINSLENEGVRQSLRSSTMPKETPTLPEVAQALGKGGYVSRNQLLEFDPAQEAEFQRYLAQLPPEQRQRADRSYFDHLMKAGLYPKAAGRVLDLPLEQDALIEQVANLTAHWTYEAPGEATAWVSQMPDGPVKEWAARNAAAQWARANPAGAEAWAKSLPEGQARQAALSGLGTSKPAW